jgi:hypothetical protein
MATRSSAARKAGGRSAPEGQGDAGSRRTGGPTELRFEATLGDMPYRKALATVTAMDLDRLPDVEGRVRLLLTPDDARRLLERGVPVHLERAHPVARCTRCACAPEAVPAHVAAC